MQWFCLLNGSIYITPVDHATKECDVGVIWHDLNVMWCESDVTWYRCDVRVICLWCPWYGRIMVWCYMKAMWYAVRHKYDMGMIWCGVRDVEVIWCRTKSHHMLLHHITSTSRTSHHIIIISQNHITSHKFNMTPLYILSYYVITGISQPYHTFVALHQFCIKSHLSHAISFHTT